MVIGRARRAGRRAARRGSARTARRAAAGASRARRRAARRPGVRRPAAAARPSGSAAPGTPSAASAPGSTSARLAGAVARARTGVDVRRPDRSSGRRASRCSWVAMSRYGRRAASGQFERRPAPPGRASATAPGTRSATTRTPWICSTASPAAASSAVRGVGVEAAAQRVAGAGAAVRVAQQRGRDVELAGDRAGQHGGGPVGDEHAGRAAGAQRAGERRRPPARVVDDLQHGVAEHQVDAGRPRPARRASRRRPARRATRSATPASAARRVSAASASGLGSTTVTVWPASGQRHGEPAGAAADVDHGELGGRRRRSSSRAQHRPDHGGTRGQRRPGELASGLLHPVEPSLPGPVALAAGGGDARDEVPLGRGRTG